MKLSTDQVKRLVGRNRHISCWLRTRSISQDRGKTTKRNEQFPKKARCWPSIKRPVSCRQSLWSISWHPSISVICTVMGVSYAVFLSTKGVIRTCRLMSCRTLTSESLSPGISSPSCIRLIKDTGLISVPAFSNRPLMNANKNTL